MAKPQERSASIKETGEELPADQWKRFEAAVDAAVKSGPKPRAAKEQATVAASKPSKDKGTR